MKGKTVAMMKHLRTIHKLKMGRPMKRNKTRKGLEYFNEDPDDDMKLICKLCDKSCSSANIVRHLQSKHEDVIQDNLTTRKKQTVSTSEENYSVSPSKSLEKTSVPLKSTSPLELILDYLGTSA